MWLQNRNSYTVTKKKFFLSLTHILSYYAFSSSSLFLSFLHVVSNFHPQLLYIPKKKKGKTFSPNWTVTEAQKGRKSGVSEWVSKVDVCIPLGVRRHTHIVFWSWMRWNENNIKRKKRNYIWKKEGFHLLHALPFGNKSSFFPFVISKMKDSKMSNIINDITVQRTLHAYLFKSV